MTRPDSSEASVAPPAQRAPDVPAGTPRAIDVVPLKPGKSGGTGGGTGRPEATTPPGSAPALAPAGTHAPASAAAARAPAAPGVRSGRDSVPARAALALALLLGYFVLAAGLVGGLGLLTVQAFTQAGSGVLTTKLAIFTGIVGLAVARAVFAIERQGDSGPAGVPVPRAEQPDLWALIDDVSATLGMPSPDDLVLVEDVNAFVHQDTRFLGLVAGDRHMGIGVGLLQVLTVDELRSVVAHELGHYAGGDTRVSALVYRASATIERTVEHLGPQSLIGRVFAWYALLYQRVSLAVRRRQELRADEGSVLVAGQAVHESLMRQLQACSPAWEFFGDAYVVPLWQAGTAPVDLYAGYRALLADPARQAELAELRADDDGPADPYDSHPSAAERIAHVRDLPHREAPGDTRPARSLLTAPDAVERAVTRYVNERALDQVPTSLYSFSVGPLDATPYIAGLQEAVDELSAATALADGGERPASLGRTLQVLEQGGVRELVTAVTGDRRDLGPVVREEQLRGLVQGLVADVAACALVRAGRASWRAGWSAPLHLVGADGQELDLSARLDEALEAGGYGRCGHC